MSLLTLASLVTLLAAPAGTPLTPDDLAGEWTGTLQYGGEATPVGFQFTPDSTGRVAIIYTLPALHMNHTTLGVTKFVAAGDSVKLGPFSLVLDRAKDRLTGIMPGELFPEHGVQVALHRGAAPTLPSRPTPSSTTVPAWSFVGDSAMWAGPSYADGRVFVGSLGGSLVALDASTGAKLWRFGAGGPIRSLPTVSGDAVYFLAEDGVLYRLDAASGALVWQMTLLRPPVRLPFFDPKSKFDAFTSQVTVSGDRLYVGTYDGRIVALSPQDGRVLWEFQTGDLVLAAPAVREGRVYAGSYDGFVYALDASSGRLVWKHDTRGHVVSTPAPAGDRLVIGNRIYDLLALDARTGRVQWTRYQWGTWVESSATIREGVAYVGSSDGATVSAWDAATGKRRWITDVLGWAWGRPAVTTDRVYTCTSGDIGYPVPNRGTVVALNRASGEVIWRYAPEAPADGVWGFPGSVALGPRYVYASGADGKVVALPR